MNNLGLKLSDTIKSLSQEKIMSKITDCVIIPHAINPFSRLLFSLKPRLTRFKIYAFAL